MSWSQEFLGSLFCVRFKRFRSKVYRLGSRGIIPTMGKASGSGNGNWD